MIAARELCLAHGAPARGVCNAYIAQVSAEEDDRCFAMFCQGMGRMHGSHLKPTPQADVCLQIYAALRYETYETIHHRIRFRPFWARDFVWYMIPNCLQLTLLVGHAQARVQNPSPRKCLSARSLFPEVQLAKPCVEVVRASTDPSWDHSPLFFDTHKKKVFLEPVPVVGQSEMAFRHCPKFSGWPLHKFRQPLVSHISRARHAGARARAASMSEGPPEVSAPLASQLTAECGAVNLVATAVKNHGCPRRYRLSGV